MLALRYDAIYGIVNHSGEMVMCSGPLDLVEGESFEEMLKANKLKVWKRLHRWKRRRWEPRSMALTWQQKIFGYCEKVARKGAKC